MTIAGNELVIGTTWGCLIILEASTMRPITVFRPYEDEIRNIIYFNGSQVFDCNSDSNSLTDPNEIKDQSVNSSSNCQQSTSDEYIITIGKGYRNLANRFVHDSRDGEIQYYMNGFYCILWKSGNWILN